MIQRTYDLPHPFFGQPPCLICSYHGRDMCICTAEEIAEFKARVERINEILKSNPGTTDFMLSDLVEAAREPQCLGIEGPDITQLYRMELEKKACDGDLCHCGSPKGECLDEGGRPTE